jgi:AcrR family transcriptional regulator
MGVPPPNRRRNHVRLLPVYEDHRARRRAETHQRIFRAAMRLFQERGYEEATIAQLAAAAGVSVPTFYDHFPSKDHLIMAVPTQDRLTQLLRDQPADLPLSERLRGAILAFLADLGAADRVEVLDRWRIIAATPALRRRAAEYERTTAEMVLSALETESPGGVTFDDRVAVSATFSAYTEILLRWAEGGGAESLETVTDEILAVLRRL